MANKSPSISGDSPPSPSRQNTTQIPDAVKNAETTGDSNELPAAEKSTDEPPHQDTSQQKNEQQLDTDAEKQTTNNGDDTKKPDDSQNGSSADPAAEEKSDILTDEELKERYGEKYEFNEAYTLGKKSSDPVRQNALEQFLKYTVRRFVLGKNLQQTTDSILKMAVEGKSDYEIYNYMRELQHEQLNLQQEEKEKKLRSVEKEKYSKTIDHKVRKLRSVLRDHGIGYGKYGIISKVLDIGTEKIEFLNSLRDGLYVQQKKDGMVQGINIDDGFCHYDADLFYNNTQDARFRLYDGKNIPFKDEEFDLITMYSVIHHIPTENFREVAKDIARVCSKVLFIKDVDMSDRVDNIFFRVQHYLYEGILTPGSTSYLNDEVTMENTIKILEDAGFETLDSKLVGNFNGTYFAILKKKGVELPSPHKRKRENPPWTRNVRPHDDLYAPYRGPDTHPRQMPQRPPYPPYGGPPPPNGYGEPYYQEPYYQRGPPPPYYPPYGGPPPSNGYRDPYYQDQRGYHRGRGHRDHHDSRRGRRNDRRDY